MGITYTVDMTDGFTPEDKDKILEIGITNLPISIYDFGEAVYTTAYYMNGVKKVDRRTYTPLGPKPKHFTYNDSSNDLSKINGVYGLTVDGEDLSFRAHENAMNLSLEQIVSYLHHYFEFFKIPYPYDEKTIQSIIERACNEASFGDEMLRSMGTWDYMALLVKNAMKEPIDDITLD